MRTEFVYERGVSPHLRYRSCLFRTLNEAQEITECWLGEYDSERPHESLNNLTSEEYRLMAEKPELSKSAWN